jgi:hypothetical protein
VLTGDIASKNDTVPAAQDGDVCAITDEVADCFATGLVKRDWRS